MFDEHLLHIQRLRVKHICYDDEMDNVADLPGDMAALWFLVRRAAGLLDRASDALLRSELDVSMAQFLVLSVVDAHPGELSQTWVAQRLGLTKGTVSRQIERAVAAGLMTAQVSRRSRRENTLALTRAGKTLVRRGDAIVVEAQRALPDFDHDDLAATLRVLTSLNESLERDR